MIFQATFCQSRRHWVPAGALDTRFGFARSDLGDATLIECAAFAVTAGALQLLGSASWASRN